MALQALKILGQWFAVSLDVPVVFYSLLHSRDLRPAAVECIAQFMGRTCAQCCDRGVSEEKFDMMIFLMQHRLNMLPDFRMICSSPQAVIGG